MWKRPPSIQEPDTPTERDKMTSREDAAVLVPASLNLNFIESLINLFYFGIFEFVSSVFVVVLHPCGCRLLS